ncbi:glycosyltransferase family 4 protein [Pontibacter sp. E15-1]|uniref:glycosyltransferase family 4 protein n=1 Tax=Pontibacter sp. E15-1 TaxID=2919918 RepID=UPI001F5019E4|nr:glycosyltransferase family 4 protein [Pontibacter sp. E15-1]MCJ8164436.1 glycosyltransferase family 4 protein [Pontibacter sp. E15-1]
MKVLFIQPGCREYRVKLFEELSQSIGGVDLLHFGPRKFNGNQTVSENEGRKLKISKFHWIRGLHRHVKDYDAVVGMFDPHWLNVFLLPIFFNKKIIFWGHGKGKSGMLNIVRRTLGKRAKAVITYDEKGKAELVKLGIDTQKVFIANNTQHVPNSSDTSALPKNSFIYVGRIQARKKVEDLLEAFAMAKSQLPAGTRITVIGDGDHLKSLKAKAQELQIASSVDFVAGTTDAEELKAHFSKAYAYVSPGHVGLGVLHSFAYGVPVVTYKGDHHAPEYHNIDNEISGLLTEPKVAELAQALVKITTGGMYRQMGHTAYGHYAEKRKISQMVDAFKEAIYYTHTS